MTGLREVLDLLRLRARSWLRRGRVDDELNEELRYHLERQVEHDVAAGRDPDDARRAALAAIGGFVQTSEKCRDTRRLAAIDSIGQDARYAIRQFRRAPLFAVTAVLLLTLGMWASVTIFTFVNAALIRPLPYAAPSTLVAVFGRTPQFPRSNLSYLDYLDLKSLNRVFEAFSVMQGSAMALTTASGTERVGAVRVSADFFRTLGVAPALGRDFREGEDLKGAPATAILSHAAWMARFGGAPDVLGRTMTLNGEAHVVIGILPPSFYFAPFEPAEVYRTLRGTSGCDRSRGCHNLTGVARLRDGVALDAAAAAMATVARQLEQQYPDTNRSQGVVVMPIAGALLGETRPVLAALLAGAGLLLAIAAVNVASLLLVRSEGRRREFAVRAALGASAARVMRQFAIEGLLLVVVATIVALLAASQTTGALASLMPATALARFWYLQHAGPDPTVYAFAVLVGCGAALLFTLLPHSQLPVNRTLTGMDGGRGSSALGWRRVGSRLVVVELVLAAVLLVGAGLLSKSLYRMLAADFGFEPDGVATVSVTLPGSTYSTPERILAFARESVERIAALPGVETAAMSSMAPLVGGSTVWIRVGGRPYNGEHNEVHWRQIGAGYFSTIAARLVRGRGFDPRDDASKPAVVIVNQALVRTYFPGEDPLGRQLFYAAATSKPMEIVGIVDDVRESPVDKETPPTLYTAFAQDPAANFVVVARARGDERALLPLLTSELRRVDTGVLVSGARTVTDIIDQSPATYTRRAAAWLAGGFALSAWALAIVGLYGVIAFSVGQRTREIGVRMALGAARTTVVGLVLSEAGRLTAYGVAAGIAASMGAGLLMRSLLFEVAAWDPITLTVVAVVLGGSAILASFVPARRAASVDPTVALRAD